MQFNIVTIKTLFMKFLFVLLFSASSMNLFAQTVINDKNAQVKETTSFTGIKVSGGIDVYLSQSNEYALAVSASDAKFRDNIKTEVVNGILNISYNSGSLRFNEDRKLRAYISFKTLESLEASGASDIIINETLKAQNLKLKLSGASDMKGNLKAENLIVDMSGASTVKIAGTVTNLKIDASGASDIKNYTLSADNCIATISGASDVKITVNKTISAKASGASSLYYKGNPERKEIESSGASSISQRN